MLAYVLFGAFEKIIVVLLYGRDFSFVHLETENWCKVIGKVMLN
jgi:hypothetical protein